ncbi:MAG: AAA family ATPase, partial [bacterium]|nr:AAA family ATPase [bacterium]
MFRLLYVPLFGDYTLQGRILGFPFRILRILVGIFLVVSGTLGILAAGITWFTFPIWFFLERPALALLSFAFLGVAAFYTRLGKPHLNIEGPWEDGYYIVDFARESARNIIRRSKDAGDVFQRASRSREGKGFLFRLGPHQLTAEKVKKLDLNEVYKTSYDLAYELGFKSVRAIHLLTALFKLAGESPEDAVDTLRWEGLRWEWSHAPFIWQEDYEVGGIGGINRGWTGRVTPTLDMFSTDLTLEATKGNLRLMIGKEKPLSEAARILARARKANALLVGPPGSGKTSFVEGMAYEIIRGSKFESLRGRRLVQLDAGALLAGAQSEGALGERLQRIIDEIEISRGVILFIDEIHNLVLSGGEVETALIFNSLRPHLETGKFQLIGATSWENYRKYLAPNEAFATVFEMVEVPAASKEESLAILEYESAGMERLSTRTGN